MNPQREQILALREQNERRAETQAKARMHSETLQQSQQLQQTVIASFKALLQYLEGHTSKTEVVNQLRDVSPNIDRVTQAVESMHTTLENKDIDFGELTTLIGGMLEELKQIPKNLPTIPEQPSSFTVDNLDTLEKHFIRLEDAINGVAEKEIKAPDVHVPTPQVSVEAPVVNMDLEPVKDGLRDVVKSIKDIVIPKAPKTNTDKIERRLDKSNKLLEKLVDKPVGGSSSGGHTTPYIDHSGKPVYVELSMDFQVDDTGTYTYLGNATPGTATSADSWRIKRVVNATGVITHADGVSTFTKSWDDRATYNY